MVPYGCGTGLVGGQVAQNLPRPVLLSLERMNAIREVLPEENVILVEAGAILENVQEAAARAGRLFPLALASQGSAQIGGNLGTNAGGVNVLRYGNARDLCLGLEAVLPDGTLWNGLTRLRKNNMGYDLRNLLIGAEGTLGVITAAALKLFPRPLTEGTAIFALEGGVDRALDLLALAGDQVGQGISAIELIHHTGLTFLAETMPDLRQPFAAAPEWSVLLDLGLGAQQDPTEALSALFEAALDRGLVTDGVIASSEAQRRGLWAVRELIPEANRRIGSVASHDIALPLGRIADFVEAGSAVVAGFGALRINCFGHLGDGNLHYNVFPPKGGAASDYDAIRRPLTRALYDLVHEMGGSISAEHGIGRLKVGDLERYGDPAKLAAMRAVKAALDPAGIMNPGAVLRVPE